MEARMKRVILIIGMFAILGGLVFAVGPREKEGVELFLANVNPDDPTMGAWIAPFVAAHPDVKITEVPVDVQGATTITMDNRIKSGLPINAYVDYYSRAGKYTVHPVIKALDLAKYWPKADVDAFLPGTLDPYWIDGKLTAAPYAQMVVGMQINKTILKKAGYTLPAPEDWTMDEFLKMCAAVKKAKIPNTWATEMFAENRSGDWMYMGWVPAFGAELFANGYDKTTINSPEGLKLFEFWKMLQDKGYIPEEAAMMNDDNMIYDREAGLLAAAGARLGDYNNAEAMRGKIDQGIVTEPFESVYYPYPRSGDKMVPVLGTTTLVVGFDSGDEYINSLTAELLGCIVGKRAQEMFCQQPTSAVVPSRSDVDHGHTEQWFKDAQAIINQAGYFDVGGSLPVYNEIRGALFPQLQLLFTGEATPKEALELYEKALNDTLDLLK